MRCFSNDENDPVDPDLCAVPILLPTDHDVVSHPPGASLKLHQGSTHDYHAVSKPLHKALARFCHLSLLTCKLPPHSANAGCERFR